MLADDPKALWRRQAYETTAVPPGRLRARMRRARSRVLVRNALEYAAAAFVIAVFAYRAVQLDEPLMKIGSGLIVLGALVVAIELGRRSSFRTPSDEAAASMHFLRDELVRQRKAVESVWLWYLAPFVPGMSLFLLGRMMAAAPEQRGPVWIAIAFTIGVFAAVWGLNRLAAWRLREEIRELETEEREP